MLFIASFSACFFVVYCYSYAHVHACTTYFSPIGADAIKSAIPVDKEKEGDI